jgi:DNA-binding response OmpR family regulator
VNLRFETSGDPAERRQFMATATVSATLNIPVSERLCTIDRILVIQSDSESRKILRQLLSSEGYEVDVASDAAYGLERLRQAVPVAVILGLPRPVSSGCNICKRIANLIPGLPLVILSESSDVADKVLLLELGAHDYVTVPFNPRELLARLRALVKRSRLNREGVYVFGDVIVDFSKTEITRGGEKIMVTRKEFKTLEFLTKNAQRVISRDELLDKVWGYENYPCTRTVDNHMLKLRQKLESDPSHPTHFLTVHGMGYKFVP